MPKITGRERNKRGGPRTAIGKDISKRNALKHGIFSYAVVAYGESFNKFSRLLKGLKADLKPQGTLENLLVEKLASLTWRYRRLLNVERAEIYMSRLWHPLTEERARREAEKALMVFKFERPGPGLITLTENPIIRKRCAALLDTLATIVEIRGLNMSVDMPLLKIVFGDGDFREPMKNLYSMCENPGNLANDPKLREFDLPPKQRAEKFLEILRGCRKTLEETPGDEFLKEQRERAEASCSGVPESSRLDRLIRYEASLERPFDRTLNQLERLQRIRLGQFVPPEQRLRITQEP